SWTDKIRAYEVYQGSTSLATRYATEQFRVLIVVPSQARLVRVAEEVTYMTRHASAAYRFLHASHVHPTTIRRGWQRIAEVEWASRRVIDRLVETPTVTLAPQALWENE